MISTWVETLNAWASGWSSFMGRALLDSSTLLAVVLLIWLPLRRRMSAQFAHGLFLLVLLKLAVPFPASWPTWSVDAPLKRVASGVSAWAVAAARSVAGGGPGRGGRADRRGDWPPSRSSPPSILAPRPKPSVTRVVAPTAKPPTSLSTSAKLMLAWAAVSARAVCPGSSAPPG